MLFSVSCSIVNMLSTDSSSSSGSDRQLNSKGLREFTLQILDSDIKREVKGLPPRGGYKSWNDSWLLRIEACQRNSADRNEHYAEYIISQRRLNGLPELR